MNKKCVRIFTMLFVFSLLLTGFTGCSNAKVKDKFDHFIFGTTFDMCKEQFKNYKIETEGNEYIEIENYKTIDGKQLSLTLSFTNRLVIDSDMKELDDYRLTNYSYSIREVDNNYSKQLVENFCKVYGEPESNNYFELSAKDTEWRSAIWNTADINIQIHDIINSNSFTFIGFRIADNDRKNFKKYVTKK